MAISKFTERITNFLINRKSKISPVNFNRATNNMKSCLICMPASLEQVRSASIILSDIAATFANRKINILLTCSIDPQSHEIIKKFSSIRLGETDLDRFSLPTKEFINKIATGGVGICIDLDPSPNFFNAVVAVRCGAEIRASFDKGVGLPYYNLLVKSAGGSSNLKDKYSALSTFLRNFSA